MSGEPGYTRFHPRWHRERMPIFWWLGKVAYVKFIARELTSIAVAYAGVLLLLQIRAQAQGPEAAERFLELLLSPWLMAVNAIALAALLFHTITWLNLTPQALVVKLAGRRIPDWAILAGHYAAWLAVSAILLWFLLGSG